MLNISGKVTDRWNPNVIGGQPVLVTFWSLQPPTRTALEAKAGLRAHKSTTSSPELRQGLSYYLGVKV